MLIQGISCICQFITQEVVILLIKVPFFVSNHPKLYQSVYFIQGCINNNELL